MAFGIIFVLMIAMSIVSYRNLAHIESANKELLDEMEIIHLLKIGVWTILCGSTSLAPFHEVKFDGQLDYRICNLGKWYYDYLESAKFEASPEEIQQKILALEEPHRKMHLSAAKITDLQDGSSPLSKQQALKIYNEDVVPSINKMGAIMDELKELYHHEQEKSLAEIEKHGINVRRVYSNHYSRLAGNTMHFHFVFQCHSKTDSNNSGTSLGNCQRKPYPQNWYKIQR